MFFFLAHIQREQLQQVIQFLQKHDLIFHRIKNEKQRTASSYLRQNANYMAESTKPITQEQFLTISNFLCSKTLVVGFSYGKQI